MYRALSDLVEPYTLLFLVLGAVLVCLWWRRREMRRTLLWVIIPFAVLATASTPIIGSLALATLEDRYEPLVSRQDDVGALVVFGGGVLRPDSPDGEGMPSCDTVYRCLHAAELYHSAAPCPVVISCSAADPARSLPSSTEAMYKLLLSLGISKDDLIADDRASSTFENAKYCREHLADVGIEKVMLITQALHMERARRALEAQGIEVVPAPCNFKSNQLGRGISDCIPSPHGAAAFHAAAHEWIGMAWYAINGRI